MKIHYVPSNEGKIRTEDICYPTFKAAPSILRKCISVLYVKTFLPMMYVSMQK